MSSRSRLYGLDALRVYAALSVVSSHMGGYRRGLLDLLALNNGHSVTLFFTLTGFLLALKLLRMSPDALDVRPLLARRWRRLFPQVAAAVLLTGVAAVIIPAGNFDPLAMLAALLFSYHVYIAAGVGFMHGIGQFWSLGLSEYAYTMIAALYAVFRRVPSIALAIIGVKLLLLALAALAGNRAVFDVLRFWRVEAFAVGMLAAWAWERRSTALDALRSVRRVVYVLAVVLVVFDVQIGGVGGAFVASLIGAAVILLLLDRPRPALDNPVIGYLAKLSYGVYCWHILILYIVGVGNLTGDAYTLTAYGLTLAVAALAYQIIERPARTRRAHRVALNAATN